MTAWRKEEEDTAQTRQTKEGEYASDSKVVRPRGITFSKRRRLIL